MATSAVPCEERGATLTYILQNGAIKVVKALALKRIHELKPTNCDAHAWTVGTFLKANEEKILKSRIGRNNEWRYFPTDSAADIDTWDLNAIIFILTDTCSLKSDLKMFLEQLRKVRNKVVHASNKTFKGDDDAFEHNRTKLSVIIERCLMEIGNEELAKEIEEMDKRISEGNFLRTETIYQRNRDVREPLEKEDRVPDETPGHKLGTTIGLLQILQPHMATDNVPELKVAIEAKNCTEDKNVELSQRMVEIFNDVIYKTYDDFREQSNEFRHNLREAVYETCLIFLSNGIQVEKAEEKCVLLQIKCTSLVALLVLFRDYIDGILDKHIQVLQSAVRRCSGYEDTCLEVIVYKDDFWQILNQIAEDLNKCVSAKETSEQEHPLNGKSTISSGKGLVMLDKASPVDSKNGSDESLQKHSTTDKNTLPSERHTQRTGEKPIEESDKEPKATDKEETEKKD